MSLAVSDTHSTINAEELEADLAVVCGQVNAAQAQLVDLVA